MFVETRQQFQHDMRQERQSRKLEVESLQAKIQELECAVRTQEMASAAKIQKLECAAGQSASNQYATLMVSSSKRGFGSIGR